MPENTTPRGPLEKNLHAAFASFILYNGGPDRIDMAPAFYTKLIQELSKNGSEITLNGEGTGGIELSWPMILEGVGRKEYRIPVTLKEGMEVPILCVREKRIVL